MNSSTQFNAATSGNRGAPMCAPIDNGAPEWSPENAQPVNGRGAPACAPKTSLAVRQRIKIWAAALLLALAAMPQMVTAQVAVITKHPVSQSTTIGGSVSFTIDFNATEATNITWWEQRPESMTWASVHPANTNFTGQGSMTLTIVNAPENFNNRKYRVDLTNASGTVTSNAATLTITNASAPPVITTSSPLPDATVGVPYSVTLAATSAIPFTWELLTTWGTGSLPTGLSFNASTGVISGTPTNNIASSFVINATNSAGFDSRTFKINFANTGTAPTIGTQPSNRSVPAGSNTSFSVSGVTGTEPLTYTWYSRSGPGSAWASLYNSGIYSGVKTATLTLTGVTAADNGREYFVYIDGPGGQAKSNEVKLIVTEPVPPPVITIQPTNATTTEGTATSFNCLATGGGYRDYQWQFRTSSTGSWTTVSNGGIFAGAKLIKLDILSGVTTAYNGYQFRCMMSNEGGTVYTDPATLTVNPPTLNFTVGALNVPAGNINTMITPVDVSGAVSGGRAPYTFSKLGSTPSWIDVSPSGVVTGRRPPSVQTATTVGIQVIDDVGQVRNISLPIGAVNFVDAGTLTTIPEVFVNINPVVGSLASTITHSLPAGANYTVTSVAFYDSGVNAITGTPRATALVNNAEYILRINISANSGYDFSLPMKDYVNGKLQNNYQFLSSPSLLDVTIFYYFMLGELPDASANPPAKPEVFTATGGNGQVFLEWSEAYNGGKPITEYQYRYRDASPYTGTWTSWITVPGSSASTVSYTVEGLTNGHNSGFGYDFEIRAVNSKGDGASAPGIGTVSATPSTTPDAPTGFATTAGDGQVSLTWTTPFNGGRVLTGYEISYGTSAGYTTSWSAMPGSTAGTTTYTVTGLTNGTEYTFEIRAVNLNGKGIGSGVRIETPIALLGAGSAAISGVTAPVAGATPVTTVTATAEYTGTVAWSPADATFGYSTPYTATIILTPKAGYSFDGVTADFFTVTGATATNAANSDVVTAVFPETAAAPTYTATLTVNKDGSAFAAHGKTFTLRESGSDLDLYTGTGTSGTVTFSSVANGTYDIYESGLDTGEKITVSGGAASKTLNYYTVTFSISSESGDAAGSTISAGYNGMLIASGAVVLGGSTLDVEVQGKGATTYNYTWGGTASGTSDSYTTTVSAAVNATCAITGTTALTAPTITTTSLSGGSIGTAYSQTLAATGTPTITWSVVSGSLPGGISLSTAGVISGTPTTAGTFTFTVSATNGAGSDDKALSIVIATPPPPTYPPSITTSTLPDGTVGVAYSRTLAASGTTPITWSVASGSLPAGLSLSTAGVLSGTPTSADTFTFTVRATNGAGSSTKFLSIVIATPPPPTYPPSITTYTLSDGTVGVAYSQTLAASGTTPIIWSVTSGSLPAGLSLSTAGVLSGTPTVAGSYAFTVRASNSAGSNSRAFTITVANPVYYIDIPTTAGGVVQASPLYVAEAGQTVTLTVIPDAGNELKSIAVTTYAGVNVALSGTDATRTFTMPASHVTVTAVFHNPTSNKNIAQENGIKAYVVNGTLNVNRLPAGDTWSIYNLTGTLIYSGTATADKVEIVLPAHGIYFVSNGTATIKVIY